MTANAVDLKSCNIYLPTRKSRISDNIPDSTLVPVPPNRVKSRSRPKYHRPAFEGKSISYTDPIIETPEHEDKRSSWSAITRKKVGDYLVGETLGKGTFGKVKIGMHIITREKVAIKILEKKKIIEVADAERVSREIMILKRNRHRNVIQLLEVIDSPDKIFLIMEYADSGEMFDFIVTNKRLPERLAVSLFQQLLQGLSHVHANGVSHRDLKPENLLLQSSKTCATGYLIKIADFGLSNTHDQSKLLSTACGSPCYAAPELIQGKKYDGPKADIWSVGVILFAMVCGFLPFEDSNTAQLYKKILHAEYKTPAFLSSQVQDLLALILETDPNQRYSMDKILQHPWVASVPNSIQQCLPEEDQEPINCLVLHELQDLGFDTTQLAIDMSANARNSLTATYYLLYTKKMRAFLNNAPSTQNKSNNVRSRNIVNEQSSKPYSGRMILNACEGRATHVPAVKAQNPLKEIGSRLSGLTDARKTSIDASDNVTSYKITLPSADRCANALHVPMKQSVAVHQGRTLKISTLASSHAPDTSISTTEMQLIPVVPVPPSRVKKHVVPNNDNAPKRLTDNPKHTDRRNYFSLKPVKAVSLRSKRSTRMSPNPNFIQAEASRSAMASMNLQDIRSSCNYKKSVNYGQEICDQAMTHGYRSQVPVETYVTKQDENRSSEKVDEYR